ncbi:hypothetical protein LI328DRAFT_34773 [Trichoderma asperelloides]|nr:hypothetical protein LI328DRAFT_34773 [Trichoderma asperelloides]
MNFFFSFFFFLSFFFLFFFCACVYLCPIHTLCPFIVLGDSRILHCRPAPRCESSTLSDVSQPRGDFPNIYHFAGRILHRLFSPPTQPGYPGCRPNSCARTVANVI